jgi:acyl dehydratase
MTALPDFMQPGHEENLGAHTFTPEEIIRFARRFDPQPFHLSEEAARNSIFGGLCASGWHTVSVWMRKQRDTAAARSREALMTGEKLPQAGVSPGFRDLRWLRPVMAGDTITYHAKTISCRPSASRTGWYIMESANRGDNQHGETVVTFTGSVLLEMQE